MNSKNRSLTTSSIERPLPSSGFRRPVERVGDDDGVLILGVRRPALSHLGRRALPDRCRWDRLPPQFPDRCADGRFEAERESRHRRVGVGSAVDDADEVAVDDGLIEGVG